MGNGPKINLLNMRQWSHKEIKIWAQSCERCLEQVPGDFGLATNCAALTCGKKIEKQKRRKLRYKGLIVVISNIDSLEVEPVARLLQESTI